MSARLLMGDPKHEIRHIFQDDMESLLYVVLYCALRWQPNNLRGDQLSLIIYELFEEATLASGVLVGGLGKKSNADYRHYTDRVHYASGNLESWLLKMMHYHAPYLHTPERFKNKWSDPDAIDAFWADFLRTHPDLEPANRVEKKPFYLSRLEQDSYTPSPSPDVSRPATPPEGSSRRRKREKMSSEPSADLLPSKSARRSAASAPSRSPPRGEQTQGEEAESSRQQKDSQPVETGTAGRGKRKSGAQSSRGKARGRPRGRSRKRK